MTDEKYNAMRDAADRQAFVATAAWAVTIVAASATALVMALGCQRPQPIYVAQPQGTPRPRVIRSSISPIQSAMPAAVIALPSADQPAPPTPEPGPAPEPDGEKCAACNGVGRIPSGDGLGWRECGDCGGDGKTSLADVIGLIRQANPPAVASTATAAAPLPASNTAMGDERLAAIEADLAGIRAALNRPVDEQQPPAAVALPAPTLHWCNGIEEAKSLAAETGKPALAYFTAWSCEPCHRFERDYLGDPIMRRYVHERFCCVARVDAEADEATADEWGVSEIPALFMVAADWSTRERVPRERGIDGSLRSMRAWFEKEAARIMRASTVRRASTSAIVQRQTASHGSTGGYGYAQPVVYATPFTYAQPAYSGGRVMVCGPEGCSFQ